MSSSLKPPRPKDLATSLYCWATGLRGVKRVPKASKQIRRFFLDMVSMDKEIKVKKGNEEVHGREEEG